MKKIITMVLLLALGVSGWYYYGSDVEKNNEMIENKVVEEIKTEPVEKENIVDKVEKIVEKIIESEEPVEEKPQSGTDEKPQIKPAPDVPKKEETVKKPSPKEIETEIVKRYSGKFFALKKEYEGKINNLIGEAKAEYYSIPEDKRSEAKWNLGFKYLKKGKELEEECDARFNGILSKMKAELEKNSLSDAAVKDAKKQYDTEKSARRKMLLSKAMNKG